MSEKLTYDQNAAERAVANYGEYKKQVGMQQEARTNNEVLAELNEIAAKGVMGKIASMHRRRQLESQALKHEYEINGKKYSAYVSHDQRFADGQFVDDALKEGAAEIAEHGAAHYDNAVIEANNDFINRGSTERINVPVQAPESAEEHIDVSLRKAA